MEITVIFPAYNEQESLRATMEKALTSLRAQFRSFEILLVNDCSRDHTGAIAEELAVQHPEIRVIHNERNLGAGATLKNAFALSRGDLVIHNAIDYPFDLDDLKLLLPVLSEADIVVAVRKQRAGYTAYRKITSFVNLVLLRALFNLKLRDYNFTQLYRRAVLETVKVDTSSTAFLTPETLIRAFEMGFRIREVDVNYYPRTTGQATSGSPRVIVRSVRDMFAFWIRKNFGGASRETACPKTGKGKISR